MSNQKIIRIESRPRQFNVTWMLGSRCNYDCMYCPSDLHDKTSQHHDLETLQKAWHQIVDKTQHLGLQYKIAFTGGEVTTNRNFLPLLEWIRSETPNCEIFLCSNGSASLNYYRRLANAVNGIALSTHSEFIDEKKFFQTALALNKIMIRPEKSLHVNIMEEHWNKDRNSLYENFCKDHDISYSLNYVDYTKKIRSDILREGKYNLESI